MDIEELISALKNDVESGNYMLQIIFDRHINEIEKLKSEGITYKRMMVLLNEEIENEFTKSHFSNLIFRAKKKIKIVESVIKTEQVTPSLEVNKLKNEVVTSEKETTKFKQSKDEWLIETTLDMPDSLILRLEKNGIDTEELNRLGFNTVSKIQKYLTQLEHKK